MVDDLLLILLSKGIWLPRLYLEILLSMLAYLFIKQLLRFFVHYQGCLDLTKRGCSLPTQWFFGHLKLFPDTRDGFTRRLNEMVRLKGIFIAWFGPFNVVVYPHRPETLATFFYSSTAKDEQMYGFLRPWLGDGLVTASGDKWSRDRKLLNRAFHNKALKLYIPINNQCAKLLVNKWLSRYEDCFDVTDDVSKLTMDIMLQTLMSTKSDCQKDINNQYRASIREMLSVILKRLRSPILMVDWIFWLSSAGKRFKKANDYVQKDGERVIREKREFLAHNKGNWHGDSIEEKNQFDIIDILLRSKDESGKGLSVTEIQDQVNSFLFAGQDTTSSGISWLLYNLARHPLYQQRCREEVLKIIGCRQAVQWDDLNKLAYLGMCIKESLRLNPPVSYTARKFNTSATFADEYCSGGKLHVGPGTSSVVNIAVVHRSELNWENPLTYDPERFSPDNASKHHPLAFLAFSAGPRNCIGKAFAMNEIKVVLCHILKNFKLSVDANTPETIMKPGIILQSESGVNLRITKINNEK